MKDPDLRLKKIAKVISNLGHPFILLPLFIFYITFYYQLYLASGLLSLALLVVILLTFSRVKQGKATDMDISVREQRYYLFITAAVALAGVIIVLVITRQSPDFILGSSSALLLIILAGLLNLKYKVSLHAAFSFFIAFVLLPINAIISISVFVLGILIAISRVIVKRHLKSEVVIGSLLGIGIGVGYYYLQFRI